MTKKATKTIILSGEEYNISFNFGVMKLICKETGLTMPLVIQAVEKMDINIIGAILSNGIKFNHKDFDVSIINAMDLMEMFKAVEVIGELLISAMPTEDIKKKTPAPKNN